jgi:hypothetical protein
LDSQSSSIQNKSSKEQSKRHRRAQNPFPSLLGPKCFRLAEIINHGGLSLNRRKGAESGASSRRSNEELGPVNSGELVVVDSIQNMEGVELEVVLPCQNNFASTSGVQHLLGEDSLGDLDGFIAERDNPLVQELEAEKLLTEQKGLGMHFNQRDDPPVPKMVDLEVRDRIEVTADQESNGLQ